MDIFFRALSAGLMIVLPIILGFYLWRWQNQNLKLFGIGALTFIASQVVHLPILYGLTILFQQKILPAPPKELSLYFNAVVLGLLSGLCEEIARYLFYRYVAKDARSFWQGMMFGAGHGGIEAILLGGVVAVTLAQMLALRNIDLSTLPIPPEQLALAQTQVAEYWNAAPSLIMLAPLERVFALTLHLTLSVVVMQAVRQHKILYLGFAIFWHALLNGVAVVAISWVGAYWTEALIGAFAVSNVIGLIWLHRSDTATPAATVI